MSECIRYTCVEDYLMNMINEKMDDIDAFFDQYEHYLKEIDKMPDILFVGMGNTKEKMVENARKHFMRQLARLMDEDFRNEFVVIDYDDDDLPNGKSSGYINDLKGHSEW